MVSSASIVADDIQHLIMYVYIIDGVHKKSPYT